VAARGFDVQELALHYKDVGFVRFYGNVSEAAKHLFKERLMARVTPTFYFFRNGAQRPIQAAALPVAPQSALRMHTHYPTCLLLHESKLS
jgi:hypothetical protein